MLFRSRAEDCVGIRFVEPGQQRPSVEVAAGIETSDATLAACAEVARRMGMEWTVAREQAESSVGGEPRREARGKGASE